MTTEQKREFNKITTGCRYISLQLAYLLENKIITQTDYAKLRLIYRNMMNTPMKKKSLKLQKENILLVNIIYNIIK
jgi:hypothetical protein